MKTTKYYKREYDNYSIIINKLSSLLEENNLILVEKTRKGKFNPSRKNIEKIFGDLKYSELEQYSELLDNILDK